MVSTTDVDARSSAVSTTTPTATTTTKNVPQQSTILKIMQRIFAKNLLIFFLTVPQFFEK
jgi:hypothetical protein